MKPFLAILLFLCFTLTALGQQDSGFTNPNGSLWDKAEAKNLTVNGKKEGKWVEYIQRNIELYHDTSRWADVQPAARYREDSTSDTNATFYKLTIYDKGSPVGKVRKYFSNGSLEMVETYINGMKNGVHREYTDSGKLELEEPYKNDTLNGLKKEWYYLTSTSAWDYIEIMYDMGQKNGQEKEYFYGKIEHEAVYNHGKLNGLCIDYDNGKVRYLANYVDGKKEGMVKYYYHNTAQVMLETPYRHDTVSGDAQCYYVSGQLKSVSYTYEGKEMHREYYETGILSLESIYDSASTKKARKTYNEQGRLISMTNYKKDMIIGTAKEYEYDTTGKLVKVIVNEYNENGKFLKMHEVNGNEIKR